MATIVLLPEAVRGNIGFGRTGDVAPHHAIAASVPQHVALTFQSTSWLVPGLMMDMMLQASFDAGVVWVDYGGFRGALSGLIGPDLAVQLPSLKISWDGRFQLEPHKFQIQGRFSAHKI